MNKNDNNKTFNEELEKELQSGLHNTLDEDQGQDFTVKVHREEYVVKRRFYDKEKALETAEDLRRDKRNVVEDNLEGQPLSSNTEDEEIDWDKLVDAGLQFDPPIAQAADLKPGDQPVSLIKPVGLPALDDDDKNLEKTFLVKLKSTKAPDETLDEDTFNGEVEREVDAVVIEEEDTLEEVTQKGNINQITETMVETQEDPPEKKRAKSRYAGPMHSESPKRSKRNLWVVVVLVVAACISALFWSIQSPDKATHTLPAPQQNKEVAESDAVPMEDKPAASVQNEKSDGIKSTVPSPDTNTIPAQTLSEAKPTHSTVDKTPAPEVVTAPETMNKNGLTIVEPLPFTVHVSSYKLIAEVDKAIAGLKGMGHVAFSGLVTIPGKGDWYRIYAGCFRSLDEASVLASDIKRTLGEDANAIKAPWAIQIGKPIISSEAGKHVSKLNTKGYRAYLLTAPDNQSSVRILIGAFVSEKATTPMVNALKKEGFKAAPALR
ncbi:MAG: SPOR domain-containing protein [Desulfobacteraceae bacterium]